MHQPVSRGFAVFADAWLSGWLAEISADLREDGSALEVVLHDYALYTNPRLLYFTYYKSMHAFFSNLRSITSSDIPLKFKNPV